MIMQKMLSCWQESSTFLQTTVTSSKNKNKNQNQNQVAYDNGKDVGKQSSTFPLQILAQESMNGSPERRRIRRVPPQLRRINDKRSYYDPTVVSLGPYHHGKPELRAAEEVKQRFLDRLTAGSDAMKSSLYAVVLENIEEIRDCYDGDCVENYDDAKLATMMLLDSFFIIAFMWGLAGEINIFSDWHQHVGAALLPFAVSDMLLLENQIPFQLVKRLVDLQSGEESRDLIEKFIYWFLSADFRPKKIPKLNRRHSLHLLEACHSMLVADDGCTASATISAFKLTKQDGYLMDVANRSAADLKALGVRFVPSDSPCIGTVKFKSGRFRGELRLPTILASSHSVVSIANFIAYEMSAAAASEFEVLSFANLLKSLIEGEEDAKELQEKGILINRFQNHQQLVEEVRGICTFGIDNFDIFKDVRMQIDEHCRSKTKTWIADLIHTRFSNPWTVTAFLAAVLLLCLGFLQTYFTIHPGIG